MADPVTGTLRTDIELIQPGEHGDFPMLFDPQADAYYKINRRSMNIISRLNRSYPVKEFLRLLQAGGIQTTEAEVLGLIAFLQQNNLLAPEYGHISAKRHQYRQMREKTSLLRFSSAYLFFRLPPWRPEKLLKTVGPYLTWLASRPFIILLTIPAVIGYLQIVRNFGEVSTTFVNNLSWAGLAKYFVAILFLKIVHEAAHVISATHFKCRIRGIGLGFMVFYPRLYTDTTDSWRLPRKQRLLIDGAGIIIELLLGGIAALLWVYLPHGPWRSTMFYVFAVSTINTIFVNGNPCIRYDGYYLLCDLTNTENLMTRSAEYVKQWWRWYFLKLGTPPHNRKGMFLLIFGICSFIYRIFLYTSIVLIIYHKFVKAVGVILVILELYSILFYPFYRELKTIRMLSKKSSNRARLILFGVITLITALLLMLPISWNIPLHGEVVPDRKQLVTINEPGYLLHKIDRRPIDVKTGDTVVKLASPQLAFTRERLSWTLQYDELLLNLQQLEERSLGRAIVSAEKINSDRLSLEEFARRREYLEIKAEFDGLFISRLREVSPGLYLPKGQIAGEVISRHIIVQAYALDREISKFSIGRKATIKLPDSLTDYTGKITEVNPVPARLRNSPLLQHFGGPIPVYLDETSPGEYPSVMALYRIEIEFDFPPDVSSGRVVKVIVHHREQLFDRVWRFILSAFRREF